MTDLTAGSLRDRDLSFRVVAAEIMVLRAPVAVPVRTSFGTMRDRPAIFLVLEDETGATGIGEVWCNFPSCGAEHRARLLLTELVPEMIGVRFDDPAACFDRLTRRFARLAVQSGEPGPLAQAIAGIDIALWDMVARRHGVPLHVLLGGGDRRIGVYASGINPAGAAETVERCREGGHVAFKLKIGFDREGDLANVEAISRSLRPGEALMVDANQAWTLEEARESVSGLAPWPIGWLEEPMMAGSDPADWRALAEATTIPLAAGENLAGAQSFARAIETKQFAVIQPDLCKWGGFTGCLPVARQALAAGLRFCPHYLGGGVGLAASAHFLAAAGGDGLLEIDSNANPLREALFAPAVEGGRIVIADAPGLGIDQAALSRLAGADAIDCTFRERVEHGEARA